VTAVAVTATALSVMRWRDDYHLFGLGVLSGLAAWLGRWARRHQGRSWVRLHIAGMGCSYLLLVTAFYVDNGKQLPVWRDLPAWSYWALPAAVGIPLMLWTLLRHPVTKWSAPRRHQNVARHD
jgi:lipopolysaccharide export LptBFGC system permease protein LptF